MEQLDRDYELCAEACVCGMEPCPVAGMKRCATCQAAGRPSIKPGLCKVRECVAARKGPVPLALTYVAPTPVPLVPLALTLTEAEEPVGNEDEVMPAPRARAPDETRCCWACDDPAMTPEEVELGYCSGRRCKAKMHPECFLSHAGEAGEALDCYTCFCPTCWATQ